MSEYSLVSVSEYSLNRWSTSEYSHVTYEWVLISWWSMSYLSHVICEWVLTCECEWVLTKQIILQWVLTYTWSITYQSHVIYEYSHLILRNKVGTCSSSNGSCTINNRPSHQYDTQTDRQTALHTAVIAMCHSWQSHHICTSITYLQTQCHTPSFYTDTSTAYYYDVKVKC